MTSIGNRKKLTMHFHADPAGEGRVLALEGIHNFRDFGAYRVAEGGRLRRGVLWRSGQHFGATDTDLARIAGLGLAHVVDLRSAAERARHPCRRAPGFAATVHVGEERARVDARAEQHAPHVDAARAQRFRDPAAMRERMHRNYGAIVTAPELTGTMRRYLALLAAGEGPVLVNCMAGKDRTGVAVAMAQLAAGVHRDDVIADYLLTNTAGDAEARIAAGREAVEAVTGPLADDVLRVLMGVEADYLESAFALVSERHGSIDAFLRDVLGADDAMRARLRNAVVE